MKQENREFYLNEESNSELDLKGILRTLLRGKKSIIIINFISIILGLVYVYSVKPVWQGTFEIVVSKDEKDNTFNNFNLAQLDIGASSNTDETQKYILKSESVLMPVFDYVKKEYKYKGEDVTKMDFKQWIKDDLNIDFEKGTSILYVKYKNTDKDFIINVLNMISKKYKDYSRKEQQKTTANTRAYLEDQKKLIQIQSDASQKEFNKFSIENGLGNIDGFVGLSNSNNSLQKNQFNSVLNDLTGGNQISNLNKINSLSNREEIAGQRYKNQFNKLEIYEAEYVDLSSKLKPNSEVLKELKIKIDNLKNSLKRPNEILLEFKRLSKIAQRDESLLNQISETLEIVKIEQNRIPNAWELISTPQIDRKKIFPNKKNIMILVLIISTFISSLWVYFKEKSTGLIYEFEEINENILLNCCLSLDKKHLKLAPTLFKKIISEEKINTDKLAIVIFEKEFSLDFLKEVTEKNSFKIIEFIDFDKNIDNYDSFIFLINKGKVTRSDLGLLNKYSNVFKDKFNSWIYVDN